LLGLRMLLFGIAEIMFGLALHHVDHELREDAGETSDPPPAAI
jgi:hypothetical protein